MSLYFVQLQRVQNRMRIFLSNFVAIEWEVMVTLGGGLLAVESLPGGSRTSSLAFVFLFAFLRYFQKYSHSHEQYFSKGKLYFFSCLMYLCLPVFFVKFDFFAKKYENGFHGGFQHLLVPLYLYLNVCQISKNRMKYKNFV